MTDLPNHLTDYSKEARNIRLLKDPNGLTPVLTATLKDRQGNDRDSGINLAQCIGIQDNALICCMQPTEFPFMFKLTYMKAYRARPAILDGTGEEQLPGDHSFSIYAINLAIKPRSLTLWINLQYEMAQRCALMT